MNPEQPSGPERRATVARAFTLAEDAVYIGLGVVLAASALTLLVTSVIDFTQRVLEQTFDRTYSVEPTTRVHIVNGDGSIRLYGAATTELRVEAIKRAYGQERLDKIHAKYQEVWANRRNSSHPETKDERTPAGQ